MKSLFAHAAGVVEEAWQSFVVSNYYVLVFSACRQCILSRASKLMILFLWTDALIQSVCSLIWPRPQLDFSYFNSFYSAFFPSRALRFTHLLGESFARQKNAFALRTFRRRATHACSLAFAFIALLHIVDLCALRTPACAEFRLSCSTRAVRFPRPILRSLSHYSPVTSQCSSPLRGLDSSYLRCAVRPPAAPRSSSGALTRPLLFLLLLSVCFFLDVLLILLWLLLLFLLSLFAFPRLSSPFRAFAFRLRWMVFNNSVATCCDSH